MPFSNSNYSPIASVTTAKPYLSVIFTPNGQTWSGNINTNPVVQNGGKDVYLTLTRDKNPSTGAVENPPVIVATIEAHSAIGVNKIELWEGTNFIVRLYP